MFQVKLSNHFLTHIQQGLDASDLFKDTWMVKVYMVLVIAYYFYHYCCLVEAIF